MMSTTYGRLVCPKPVAGGRLRVESKTRSRIFVFILGDDVE
jgi:hypothetical protein